MQLEAALQLLLDRQCKIYALKLKHGERRIDIGTPETYVEALKAVFKLTS